jgi:hypothetical protein
LLLVARDASEHFSVHDERFVQLACQLGGIRLLFELSEKFRGCEAVLDVRLQLSLGKPFHNLSEHVSRKALTVQYSANTAFDGLASFVGYAGSKVLDGDVHNAEMVVLTVIPDVSFRQPVAVREILKDRAIRAARDQALFDLEAMFGTAGFAVPD